MPVTFTEKDMCNTFYKNLPIYADQFNIGCTRDTIHIVATDPEYKYVLLPEVKINGHPQAVCVDFVGLSKDKDLLMIEVRKQLTEPFVNKIIQLLEMFNSLAFHVIIPESQLVGTITKHKEHLINLLKHHRVNIWAYAPYPARKIYLWHGGYGAIRRTCPATSIWGITPIADRLTENFVTQCIQWRVPLTRKAGTPGGGGLTIKSLLREQIKALLQANFMVGVPNDVLTSFEPLHEYIRYYKKVGQDNSLVHARRLVREVSRDMVYRIRVSLPNDTVTPESVDKLVHTLILYKFNSSDEYFSVLYDQEYIRKSISNSLSRPGFNAPSSAVTEQNPIYQDKFLLLLNTREIQALNGGHLVDYPAMRWTDYGSFGFKLASTSNSDMYGLFKNITDACFGVVNLRHTIPICYRCGYKLDYLEYTRILTELSEATEPLELGWDPKYPNIFIQRYRRLILLSYICDSCVTYAKEGTYWDFKRSFYE